MTSFLSAFTNKSPVQLSPPWSTAPKFGSRSPVSDLNAMSNVGVVFAIVNRTAETIAGIDWKLYRKRTDGRRTYAYDGMDDRQEVTQHLALRLLNRPNPFYTRGELMECWTQYMSLVGESPWVVGKHGTLPMEIWPVRPDRLAIVEHPYDYVAAYEYRNYDGTVTRLETDEVIFTRRPNPYDAYRGIGPVQSVLAKIDSSRYSDEWNRAFFLNSAEPGGIIKIGRAIKDDELRRLQFRWNESHKGPGNAHRVGILDGEDIEWVERSASQRDMQFAEMSEINTEQIRMAFGFPKPLLGSTDNVNRANADAAELMFSRWVLVPMLNRIRDMLNTDYLPMFGVAGQGVEFDYVSPVTEDREADNAELTAKANAAVALINAGAVPESALEFLGLPPIEFGGVSGADMAVPAV